MLQQISNRNGQILDFEHRVSLESIVRGYHMFKFTQWLRMLYRKSGNDSDRFAVSIFLETLELQSTGVGHVPRSISSIL